MSDIINGYEEFEKISDETKRLLNRISSRQRHDFMNMLQIITGNLQIEEYSQALNIALDYGQRTESIGRLQKHGLIVASHIIEHYVKVFSNNERRIEIVNSLPPIEQNLRKEKRAALELLDSLLEWYSQESIEKMVLNFELLENNITLRLLVPECDSIEFMDLVLKYKRLLPELETGSEKNEIVWDYIEFSLFD